MTATRTASTGHTITADLDTMTLTISGQVETMDAIPDSELEAAAALIECAVDWVSGPLDETSYGLIATDVRPEADGEPDRLQSSLDASAEEPDAPAAYAWLGCRASIWAHRGYRVEGERVLCSDLDDARRVVAESLGCSLEELVCEVGEGEYYYRSQEEAERDSDGTSAEAVVGTID